MIRVCRVCGIRAGGLVRDRYARSLPVGWQDSDLCPNCSPDAETESDRAMAAILEAARKEVQPLIEKERAGEHWPGSLLDFRMDTHQP